MDNRRCQKFINCGDPDKDYDLNLVIHRGYHKYFCDRCFIAYEEYQKGLEEGKPEMWNDSKW